MTEPLDPADIDAALSRIRDQAAREELRVTLHAQQAMIEDDVVLDDVLEVLRSGDLLENYPEHRRGACGLVGGYTAQRRPLHVVCTTTRPVLVIITVYEPQPPKWSTPTERGPRK